MTKTRLLMMLMLIGIVLPMGAQQISVEEFKRVRKHWLSSVKVAKDKQKAILELETNEKGFVITANGQEPVEVEEGEGVITLKLPHKTQFLVIRHPDYGQTTWKPAKVLKRKKHYHAYLHTSSPKKQFHPGKQWVVFDISPANAILTLDSAVYKIRDGKAQHYLPLGTHHYTVESPFHQAVRDSVVLSDTARTIVQAVLQPFYSYLTVKTPSSDYQIYVDEQLIGEGEATSGHLSPGSHQLTIRTKRSSRVYYYDERVTLPASEKVTVEIGADQLQRPYLLTDRALTPTMPTNLTVTDMAAVDSAAVQPQPVRRGAKAPVTLIAPSDSAEIWLNRELLSKGNWQGQLEEGFYMLETRQGTITTSPTYFWVEGTFPVTLNLSAPEAEYGMLSIHSNVVDADIYINHVHAGVTPAIIEHLPARHDYKVELRKTGYKTRSRKVKVRANDMVDVKIPLKER